MGLRKALLIANSQYDDPTISRLAARNDSDALEQILKDKALGYFDQVLPLIDCRSDVVLGELQAFFSDENPTDLALVYFSGHGLVDDSGHLYLAMKNTKPKSYQATSFTASFLSEQLNRISSDRLVFIIDSFYSVAFRRDT